MVLKIKTYSPERSQKSIITILLVLLIIIALVLVFKLTKKCPGAEEKCPAVPECPSCTLDCSNCPATLKYQNVTNTITKYICANKRVVDNIDDCEAPKKLSIVPKQTNEAGTAIEIVNVSKACVSGKNGGVVYFKVDTIPYNVVFELREEDTAYKEKYSLPGLLTKYKYFTICNKEDVGCQTSADFYIEKDRVFLFRAMFNQTSRYGKLEYSNEHIIDTTAGSEYLTETCAKI